MRCDAMMQRREALEQCEAVRARVPEWGQARGQTVEVRQVTVLAGFIGTEAARHVSSRTRADRQDRQDRRAVGAVRAVRAVR